MAKIMLYVGLGAVIDLLITVYYRMISVRQAFPASALGAIITLVTFVIFSKIIVSWNKRLVIAYAVGTGLGTFVGVIL